MGWYLQSIVIMCDWPTCPKQAKVKLINPVNATTGHFCTPHGQRVLNQKLGGK